MQSLPFAVAVLPMLYRVWLPPELGGAMRQCPPVLPAALAIPELMQEKLKCRNFALSEVCSLPTDLLLSYYKLHALL